MIKIDVFSHYLTPKYIEKFMSLAPDITKTVEFRQPAMTDLTIREDFMRRHPGLLQIITMGNIPPERYVPVKDAIELCKIGNDEMAELVVKKPSLFYGAVGTIPIDDVDASLDIIDYCVKDLGLFGIQLFATMERESFAEPKYRPIFAKIAELDRVIWVHPAGTLPKQGKGRFIFTWPYESSNFMLDIVDAGIMAGYPKLKIIIHHAGGMVPHYRERVRTAMPGHDEDYFKNFYTDTALYGNTSGLMSAFDYFGPDHIMFGTDAPFGGPLMGGNGCTNETILAIENMDVTDKEKEKILYGNARNLFNKPV